MGYNTKECGMRIQRLRAQHGYTQGGLAEKLNVDRSFLSYVESGKKGCSIDLLIQLSRIFNVSLDFIVLGQEWGSASQAGQRAQLKVDIENLVGHLEKFKSSL